MEQKEGKLADDIFEELVELAKINMGGTYDEIERRFEMDDWEVFCWIMQSSYEERAKNICMQDLHYASKYAFIIVAGENNLTEEELAVAMGCPEDLVCDDVENRIIDEAKEYESMAVHDAVRISDYNPVFLPKEAEEIKDICVESIINLFSAQIGEFSDGKEDLQLASDWEIICFQLKTKTLPVWDACEDAILVNYEDFVSGILEENDCEEEEFVDKMIIGLGLDYVGIENDFDDKKQCIIEIIVNEVYDRARQEHSYTLDAAVHEYFSKMILRNK